MGRKERDRKKKEREREGIKSSGILFYATIIARASPRKSSTRTGKRNGGKKRESEAARTDEKENPPGRRFSTLKLKSNDRFPRSRSFCFPYILSFILHSTLRIRYVLPFSLLYSFCLSRRIYSNIANTRCNKYRRFSYITRQTAR